MASFRIEIVGERVDGLCDGEKTSGKVDRCKKDTCVSCAAVQFVEALRASGATINGFLYAALFVFLLSFVVSCAYDVEAWHGDVTFTPAERAEIERGYAFLSKRLESRPLPIVWDAPHNDHECLATQICKRPALVGPCPEPYETQTCELVGLYTSNRISLVPSENMAAVAAHEFGHWKGLGHHAGPGAMHAPAPLFLMWTEDDDASVQAAQDARGAR